MTYQGRTVAYGPQELTYQGREVTYGLRGTDFPGWGGDLRTVGSHLPVPGSHLPTVRKSLTYRPEVTYQPSGTADGLPGALTELRVTSSLVAVDYEWDAAKAAENRRRHGIDFPESIAAIEDPNRLEEIDTRLEYGEERIRVIGMAAGSVLFVVTTLRDEKTCRIISARRATRHEQDRYYACDSEAW